MRLLFLGRIDPKKGIENLLAACQRLANVGRPWSLTIAGSGDAAYTAGLEENARKLGLRERVSFVGEVRGQAKADLSPPATSRSFPRTRRISPW